MPESVSSKPAMDTFAATMIAEGQFDLAGYSDDEPPSEDVIIEAWQTLIDTGLAWQLQGWFGRRAHDLINEGLCSPPPRRQ